MSGFGGFSLSLGTRKDARTVASEAAKKRREEHEKAQREARRAAQRAQFEASQRRALEAQAGARRDASSAAAAAGKGTPTEAARDAKADFQVVDMGAAAGRVPLPARVKRVLDCLHAAQRPLRWAEIYDVAMVDVRERELFDVLKEHPKVRFDELDKRFTYQAMYDCRSKEELLLTIQGMPEGLAVADLRDTYAAVLDDVRALREEGRIFLLTNNEKGNTQVAYPVDEAFGPPAPERVVAMWDVESLADGTLEGVERELRARGLRVAGNVAAREEAQGVRAGKAQKEHRKRMQKRLRKVTNTHLLSLFEEGGAAAGEAAAAGPGACAHK